MLFTIFMIICIHIQSEITFWFIFYLFHRNTDDSGPNGDASEHSISNSNLVATIAATEAAIRIASDIIDSTLAHADDHGEHQNDSTEHQTISGNIYI